MDLYFSRHGKTSWNQEMRFQGREGDSPLLPESYLEIKKLGQRLANLPFKKVYSSPSKRAKETAVGIVAEFSSPVEIVYLEALKELGLGELEGQKILESRVSHSEALDALRYSPDKYDPVAFGGEKYEEMLNRSLTAVLAAVEEEEEGPLLFISHGVTLTGCIQTLVGKSISQVRKMGGLSNSSLSIVRMTDSKEYKSNQLLLWNDQEHLKNEEANIHYN